MPKADCISFFCTEIKRYKRLCLGTGRKSYGEKKKININCGRKKNNPKNGRERKRKQNNKGWILEEKFII